MKIFLLLGIFVSAVYSTPVNTESIRWVQWNSKSENFPPNSVLGGKSPEHSELYVVRYLKEDYQYGTCGGDNGKSADDCFVSNNDAEKQVYDVEVLTGTKLVWCPASGQEFDPDFAICKASKKPGFAETGTWLSNGKCRIGYAENGVSGVDFIDDYEVLRNESC